MMLNVEQLKHLKKSAECCITLGLTDRVDTGQETTYGDTLGIGGIIGGLRVP